MKTQRTFHFNLDDHPQLRDDLGNLDHVKVHLAMNRITDKQHRDRGWMHRTGDTTWELTLDLSPTLTASYGFAVSSDTFPGPSHPPPHDRYELFRDIHSPHPPVVDKGEYGSSLFQGEFVATHPAWDATRFIPRAKQGAVVETTADLCGTRPVFYYSPPGRGTTPTQVLVLLDGQVWFRHLGIARALDLAHDKHLIPPTAVVGVGCTSVADRKAVLGANRDFLHAVVHHLNTWIADHPTWDPPQLQSILAGQSLSGLAALYAAITIPTRFDRIITQSPSLWWDPSERASPASLGTRSVDWITEQIFTAHPGPQVALSVGLNEVASLPRVHLLADALTRRGFNSSFSVHDGGHDYAWWRTMLIDALGNR